jgi:hypothetical protein
MTVATAGQPGTRDREPFLLLPSDHLPTALMLAAAGLPGGHLAAVQLDLARIGPAGKWHLLPGSPAGTSCARIRRAAAEGRELARRRAGLLSGPDMCRACTLRLHPAGSAGIYLAAVRRILSARAWTQTLETAAPAADWPACARWAAVSPFAGDPVPPLLSALPSDQAWESARAAAAVAWQDLSARAGAALERARSSAGPPGLRSHAAAARAIAGGEPAIVADDQLLDDIANGPAAAWERPFRPSTWAVASRAWAGAVCLDGDLAAAHAALAAAIEQRYAAAPVRDLSLLPDPPMVRGDGFASPHAWARGEFRALRQAFAAAWSRRLEAALAEVQADGADVPDRWRLLLITGWPIGTGAQDHDLAYMTFYPELGRTDLPPADLGPGHEPQPRAIVVLHVPGYAARHATAHRSPFFTATAGPVLPAGASPDPLRVRTLLRRAGAAVTRRSHSPRPRRAGERA